MFDLWLRRKWRDVVDAVIHIAFKRQFQILHNNLVLIGEKYINNNDDNNNV